MMAITHAIAGAAAAVPLLVLAPEFAVVGALAGLIGGLFPDLDLYTGHRKLLHYPVYGSAVAILAAAVAAAWTTTVTVAIAMFLIGAALHAVSDVIGAGLELEPWKGNSDRAVYDHYHDKWLEPKRLIRYDGAPEDAALAGGLASGPLLLFDGPISLLVIGLLVVGVIYATLRKPLAKAAGWLFPQLPKELHSYLPDRYFENTN